MFDVSPKSSGFPSGLEAEGESKISEEMMKNGELVA